MNIRRFHPLFLFCILVNFLPAQDRVHILAKGETIYSIARSYGVSQDAIIAANKIGDPKRVYVGQKLAIPGIPAAGGSPAGTAPSGSVPAAHPAVAPTTHRVSRGETLYGIARQYGLPLKELLSLNNLTEKSLLKEGDTLRVPGTAAAAPAGSNAVAGPSDAPTRAGTPVAAVPRVSPTPAVEPRPKVATSMKPEILWPIFAQDVSYLTGKLYGVVLSGSQSEAVKSLTYGTVVSAGPYRGFGRVVIVQAAESYVYVYGGCESLSVKEGDKIAPGTELGRLGADALTGKPQLFFLAYKDNVPIDPAKAPRA
jgi:murein DD-endopeptidase MepM/ murein hydrolase activator NlpD